MAFSLNSSLLASRILLSFSFSSICEWESLRSKRVVISFMACWMALDTSGSSILETTSKVLSGMCYESVRKIGVRIRTTGSSGGAGGPVLGVSRAAAGWVNGAAGLGAGATVIAGFGSASAVAGVIFGRASDSSATTTLSVMFSIMVIIDASSARDRKSTRL